MHSWTDDDGVEEIPLTGGDVTEGLVRVGATVRRPPGERRDLVRARGWQRSDGVGDKIRQRQTWLEQNADSITTALIT